MPALFGDTQGGQNDSPIVTYPESSISSVFFLDGDREIVAYRERAAFAEVPLAYSLTELLAGRVDCHDVTSFKQDQFLLRLLVGLYLLESGVEGLPASFVAEFPRMRYRMHWRVDRVQQLVQDAIGERQLHGIPALDIHRIVMGMLHVVEYPQFLLESWQTQGLAVREADVPLYVFQPRTSVDVALIEIWRLIDNDKNMIRCRACDVPFVPTGIRWWRQQYCPTHRNGASRQRVYLRGGRKAASVSLMETR